ncbi:hypothetical protein C2W62_02150 [Candidatus Entotheonella serta]|nr:hypothetical protein C2W62_02150 [Candidatus Entotheonella serta]
MVITLEICKVGASDGELWSLELDEASRVMRGGGGIVGNAIKAVPQPTARAPEPTGLGEMAKLRDGGSLRLVGMMS